MDIEKFRTFVATARFDTFHEAADALFVSTSTVSKHISALENALGVTLFHRLSKKVVLTEKGKLCLAHIEKSMEQYDRFIELLREDNSLAVLSVPVLYPIISLIRSFSENYPDIRLKLDTRHGKAVVKAIEAGEYELGCVSALYSDFPSLERHVFTVGQRGIVMKSDHPLAARECISLKELEKEKFHLQAPETGLYQAYVDMCERHGFTPEIAGTSNREDVILEMVRNGGVAIFADIIFRSFNCVGLSFIPLQEERAVCSALIRPKSRPLSKPASCFWDFIVQNTN